MSLKDDILKTMGPLEKLSALKLSWWIRREGKGMFNWLPLVVRVGVVMLFAALGALDQMDYLKDNVSPESEQMLENTFKILTGLGISLATLSAAARPVMKQHTMVVENETLEQRIRRLETVTNAVNPTAIQPPPAAKGGVSA